MKIVVAPDLACQNQKIMSLILFECAKTASLAGGKTVIRKIESQLAPQFLRGRTGVAVRKMGC
jgi:hypothetical protein